VSTELVTVTIDGREAQVPKGTGLVETALAAGTEIPVFCYEPRLGPPVGACRMCLVEVEGMPKLQAGCTLTAQDGMAVRTAHTSEKAAEGQNATLEFILVNHPLDCPVCDKGGECPLQDLTFRYGPGSTRMTFMKRTFDKPIPVSPHIALDRERCILCYRCTRFSEDVSEDGELVAVNRGSQSVIATFEDEPYRGRFSGNVIELCPVGALTSTEYRFLARPWEIQNVPTVCGLCPVGCNVSATTREGKVRRMLSRDHPEVDQGWLCDKGRFAYPHLYARDRVVDPLRRVRRLGFEAASWDDALDEAERLLRAAGSDVLLVLSGSETTELAYALAKLVASVGGSASLPEQVPPEPAAPLSRIAEARSIGITTEIPVEELAPVVDLWVKLARRRGAEVGRDADAEVTIGTDPGSIYWLPSTPNSRGVAHAAGHAEVATWERQSDRIGLLVVSGDEAAAEPLVRELAEGAEAVLVLSLFQGLAAGWADLVLPGTSYLERDGTMTNLEGRVQRLRRAVIPPAPDELAWLAKLAERFGVDLSPYPASVHEEIYGTPLAEVGERAELQRVAAEGTVPQRGAVPRRTTRRGLRLVRYRPLFSGPAVERVSNFDFQRPNGDAELSPDDARRLGIAAGDEVELRTNGTSARLRARVRRGLAAGVVLVPEGSAPTLAEGPVVLSAPSGGERT
jgi:NADH dehydrogenase/NADH:ubiquinone oxidoreductase subunit G